MTAADSSDLRYSLSWGGWIARQPDGSWYRVPWLTDLALSGDRAGLAFFGSSRPSGNAHQRRKARRAAERSELVLPWGGNALGLLSSSTRGPSRSTGRPTRRVSR